jgi:hypothetical protein
MATMTMTDIQVMWQFSCLTMTSLSLRAKDDRLRVVAPEPSRRISHAFRPGRSGARHDCCAYHALEHVVVPDADHRFRRAPSFPGMKTTMSASAASQGLTIVHFFSSA